MAREKRIKKTKRKTRTTLSLNCIKVTSYEEIMEEVKSEIGKRPPLPKNFSKGKWTKQALRVLSERYLIKDKKSRVIETPEEMCWRVSWEVASAEARWGKGRREVREIAEEFYNLLINHEFLPNSPTLMNAGTGNGLQYSACFVLPVEDSLVGIFDALKYQAIIHQTGGGTGFSFSKLRPNGSMVKSSSGTASGPVSFMRIFDAATNEIKQGGKRRGANMGILRVDHPDILEFIQCKQNGGITNFNISVAITDKFMEAYKRGKNYDLIDPRDGRKVNGLSARKVFEKIAKNAWETGDPGLVFIDRRNKGTSNPVPSLGPIEATNPCGEQELYSYDACNLGSIFLNYFVKEENGKREVDWQKLKDLTRIAVRFLDNVIEVNPYPLSQIRQTVFAIRRIGLGVAGWADMLIRLGIPYDSEEALGLAQRVMKTIQIEAIDATKKLAKERGPFPLWPISIYKNKEPRRNSTITTIAPTGSISIIAGASSGIEPIFAVAYQHVVNDKSLERVLTFVNSHLKEIGKERGFWNEEIEKKIVERGVIRDVEEIPEDVRRLFGTAHEIHHDWHIKMQATFQRYTENAVSKTINMANSATEKDVKEAYLLAWKTNCKGITVFRDGCKNFQVLNLGVKEERGLSNDGEALLKRPFMVSGATYKLQTPVGAAFITINEGESKEPLEVFINVGKAGSDVAAMAEALGRTISTTLRFRGELSPKERAKEITYQLAGIGGRKSVGFGSNRIRSLPDAVAVALSTHYGFQINGNGPYKNNIKTGAKSDLSGVKSDLAGTVMKAQTDLVGKTRLTGVSDHTVVSAESDLAPVGGETEEFVIEETQKLTFSVTGDICPSCGSGALVYEEGCSKCYACGHSEC